MDYFENTDTQSVKKFTKKFIVNYIIGAILIGIVVSIISEILSAFLPAQLLSISNFLLTIFGLWKISSSAVETSLKESSINSDNFNKVLKNIFIFLIILLVINISFVYITFKFSTRILSSLATALTINLIISIVATIIQYAIIMLFCKNKLEEIILGKQTNKTLYIVLLVIAVIILCSSMLFNNNNNTNNNSTNNTNSAIENKYVNANWKKFKVSTSSMTFEPKLLDIHINFDNESSKNYKALKVICTIYSTNNNSIIGKETFYFENIEPGYNLKSLEIPLSKSIDSFSDFTEELEAYILED